MEKNLNPEINRLNMETSKKAADSLREWAGLGASKTPVASSFLNGSTGQMLNESVDFKISPKSTQNTTFSFGVLNTVSALKNSSLGEIPAGKMMLEKYEHLLINKGVSEAFLIEGLIGDLNHFSWEQSVVESLANLKNILENRKREVEVVKTYESIRNAPGKDLFTDATSQMKDWLVSEGRSTETLIHGIKRFGFNPMVRNLVSFLSIYENQKSGKFSVGYDNNVCVVKNLYSPVEIFENHSIFYASGKFFKLDESKNSIVECSMDEVPSSMINKAAILADNDVKVDDNRITLNLGKNKVEIVFENDNKKIYYDGKLINENDLPLAVSVSTNNLLESSNNKISKAVFVAKAAEDFVDLDFGKKIISKVYEGAEANIFKIGDRIYVQTVNPFMKLNKVYEANATQAVNIIKDFIKYDISESLTEFLKGEEAVLSMMKNDKKEIIKNIEILENELRKIDSAKSQNPLLNGSEELMDLQESIENEITHLQDKWNQINSEIFRMEKSAKEIDPDVSEAMGYPIDTEVRIKRNGTKGKVIGVDGNSKTYTILFKEGKTGEYFFSDVEDLGDEVENYDIDTPDVNLEYSESGDTNEGMDHNFADAPGQKGSARRDNAVMNLSKKHMASAPEGKKTKGSLKFIDNEKNYNLSDAPNSKGKTPLTKNKKVGNQNLADLPKGTDGKSGKKFVDDLKNLNLADAPSASIKGSAKFIEDLKNQNLSLKENQKNVHIEKAPKGKSEKVKKFIEDEDNADFAEAPGNHKKNGKKFVEDLKKASLSAAPKAKKK
jgi:hypothetical protein